MQMQQRKRAAMWRSFPQAGIGPVLLKPSGSQCHPAGGQGLYVLGARASARGHSDAIRRIKGVKNASSTPIPVEKALEAVRNGENPDLTTRENIRECFVVARRAQTGSHRKRDRDHAQYFADYDTTCIYQRGRVCKRPQHPPLTAALSSEAAERDGRKRILISSSTA